MEKGNFRHVKDVRQRGQEDGNCLNTVVLINNFEMTALLLCISLQSINEIKKAQEKHLFKTHSHTAVPCPCSRD